jgi:multidrug resistance efflux pump
MAALDRTSSLYNRYATNLEQQENQLQTLRSEQDDLQAQQSARQAQLDALLRSLTGNS